MKIEVIDSIERLQFYKAEWESILKEINNDNVYLEPDWIICWWKCFGNKYELFALAAVNDQGVAGICPLMATDKGNCKEIDFIGDRESLRMDFILRDKSREEALKCMCDFLRSLRGKNIIKLHGIPEKSANYTLLKKYLKVNKAPSVSSYKTFYYFFLRGYDFNSFIEHRFGKRTRYTMNKKEKKLKELGNLDYKKISSAEIDEVFELHEKRWLRKIGNSSFSKGKTKEFYKILTMEESEKFSINVDAMVLNNRIVSFLYGIEYNKRYSAIRVAHDDDFYFLSPGELIFRNKIEECFSSEAVMFDFGPGYEPYKARWTDDCEKVFTTILPSDNFRSGLIFYLRYCTWIKMIDALKKNKIISNLKRHHMGKIKFLLSKAHLFSKVSRIKKTIEKNGLLSYVIGYFFNSVSKIISYKKYLILHKYLKYVEIPQIDIQVKEAAIDNLDLLSQVMNESASTIIRRFINQHKCYIALHNSTIVFYCWINCSNIEVSGMELDIPFDSRDVYAYDVFIEKKYKNEDNYKYIFSNIFNLLSRNNFRRCFVVLNSCNKSFENEMCKQIFYPGYSVIEKRIFGIIKYIIVDLKLGDKA